MSCRLRPAALLLGPNPFPPPLLPTGHWLPSIQAPGPLSRERNGPARRAAGGSARGGQEAPAPAVLSGRSFLSALPSLLSGAAGVDAKLCWGRDGSPAREELGGNLGA